MRIEGTKWNHLSLVAAHQMPMPEPPWYGQKFCINICEYLLTTKSYAYCSIQIEFLRFTTFFSHLQHFVFNIFSWMQTHIMMTFVKAMSWFHEPFFADIVAALFTYTYMNIARCNLPLIYKGTYLLSNFAYVQR